MKTTPERRRRNKAIVPLNASIYRTLSLRPEETILTYRTQSFEMTVQILSANRIQFCLIHIVSPGRLDIFYFVSLVRVDRAKSNQWWNTKPRKKSPTFLTKWWIINDEQPLKFQPVRAQQTYVDSTHILASYTNIADGRVKSLEK